MSHPDQASIVIRPSSFVIDSDFGLRLSLNPEPRTLNPEPRTLNPHPIQLVCFDLGRVLVQIAGDWADACRRSGVVLPAGDHATHDRLVQLLEVGRLDESTYLKLACECFPGIAASQFQIILDAWLVGPYEGMSDLFSALRRRGLKLACFSNTNAWHWRALTDPDGPYRELQQLDYRFASCEIGHAKPDPRAYRHVERRTGFAAGQILFFDDRSENVQAARDLGWQAEWIDPSREGLPQAVEHLRRRGLLG